MSVSEALYTTLYNHMLNAGNWGTRLQPLEVVDASISRPFLHYFKAGGGRDFSTPARDKYIFPMTVKVVADTMQGAVDGQAQISAALHNSGTQDINPRLPSVSGWRVLTVSEGREVWGEELFANTQRIYHAGYQYDITMEKI